MSDEICYKEIDSDAVISFSFELIKNQGERWQYPYPLTGLIHLPSAEEMTIYGNCSTLHSVHLKGRGLDEIFRLLKLQRLEWVRESDHYEFNQSAVSIAQITVKLLE